jgi:transposase
VSLRYLQIIIRIGGLSEAFRTAFQPPSRNTLIAAVGEDPRLFKNGRGLAAWLGLVPRQHSTGGRDRLLGISKRGDVYLRQLLIHGARAVLRWVERKDDPTSGWARGLKGRRHPNVAAVALANKIARIAYAVMTTVGSSARDPTSGWARGLKGRRHPNVAAVALANKIARIAYAVMTTGQPYDAAKGALAPV